MPGDGSDMPGDGSRSVPGGSTPGGSGGSLPGDGSRGAPGGGNSGPDGSSIEPEVASQPECWLRAAGLAAEVAGILPAPGERVAVAGCGTSWFIAQSYAAAREAAAHGATD